MAKKKRNDPTLRAAMFEIEKIIEKYNLAGNVVLANKKAAIVGKFMPTWSQIEIKTDQSGTEIGLLIDVDTSSKAAKKKELSAAAHVLGSFCLLAHQDSHNMAKVLEDLKNFLEKGESWIIENTD